MKLLIFLALFFCLLAFSAEAQSQRFTVDPAQIDGAQFKKDYNLTSKDFWIENGNTLVLRDGIKLKDNPPKVVAPNPKAALAAQQKASLDTSTELLVQRAMIAWLVDQINTLKTAAGQKPITVNSATVDIKAKIDSEANK